MVKTEYKSNFGINDVVEMEGLNNCPSHVISFDFETFVTLILAEVNSVTE